jgi:hypothetical protein
MKTRILLTAAVAGFLCAQLLDAQTVKPAAKPGAQPVARPAGPWAKVPALPTACYSTQDTYWEQNAAALAEVQQARYAQDDINGAIRQSATDSFNEDPMALAQRLQQAMMNDPQNAQKIMEQMNQSHAQAQVEAPALQEKEMQLEAEAKALVKQYKAALVRSHGAGNARWNALRKQFGLPPDATGPGEVDVPAGLQKGWYAVLRDWDAGYAANCAQWWSAAGPFHAYLKRYKDHLVLERIPYEKEFGDKPKLDSYKRMGVDATGWRTTSDYEAVEDYLKMANSLFAERALRAYCVRAVDCPI